MKNNYVNKHNLRHVLISLENFEKLKRMGYATESINDVLTKILGKNISLEEGSRVGELAKL